MSSKTCTLCKKTKPLSEFGKHRITRDGLCHWCKQCNRERGKKYRETPNGIYSNLKGQSNFFNRGPELLSRDDFLRWYASKRKICIYCGISEENVSKLGDVLNDYTFRLTIDRKDNERGYSPDNIVLSCRRCNYVKSDILTYEEMLEVGQKYIKPKWEKRLQDLNSEFMPQVLNIK